MVNRIGGYAPTRRQAARALPLPRRWELWWAYMLFYDTSDVKLRPVIILEARSDMIPVIELTTHAPRQWLIWQYPLTDWARAGLKHPSTAVLGSIATLPKEALGRRISRLSLTDKINIECMLEMQDNPASPPDAHAGINAAAYHASGDRCRRPAASKAHSHLDTRSRRRHC